MMFTPRPKGIGKDNYLNIDDGGEVTGVFKGDIHKYRSHWMQSQNRSLDCIGADCAICKQDPENYPAFKFRVNFITSKDGKWIAKVYQGGGKVYDMLVALDKKFDLSKTVVDISRSGKKQNTQYTITPRLDQPLSKEMAAAIAKVEPLSLSGEETESPEPGTDG
jgi:hypothetical protein